MEEKQTPFVDSTNSDSKKLISTLLGEVQKSQQNVLSLDTRIYEMVMRKINPFGWLLYWLIMSLAGRLSSKFHICLEASLLGHEGVCLLNMQPHSQCLNYHKCREY